MVPVGVPAAAAPGTRTDIGLLDASALHVRLREEAPVAVAAVRAQRDVAVLNQSLEPAFRGGAARLVELRGVDVGEAHLLAIAHQRVAVDRDAALRGGAGGRRRKRERKGTARDQPPNLMYLTISFCTSAGCSSRPWNIFSTSSGGI